ncbi:hypothetical protein [uncultured Sphingomonas sp.]|mgnify:CR=1|uniref:hypothetical protein n=1 Tax=uncultured Sphingomonas sp. TaxID=158754 RepID=UPI0026276226|nr:hypothetical protein [uncultured Sphingomonas sp.]
MYRPQVAAIVFREAEGRPGASGQETRKRDRTFSGLGRRIMLILALAALTFQSLVVQGHVHARGRQTTQEFAQRETFISRLPGVPTPGDDPFDCPICREMAHAGNYLLPPIAVVPVIIAQIAFMAIRPLPRHRLLAFPLVRRSRGPPEPLQAR